MPRETYNNLRITTNKYEDDWFVDMLDFDQRLIENITEIVEQITTSFDRPWTNEARVVCKRDVVRNDERHLYLSVYVMFDEAIRKPYISYDFTYVINSSA